MHAARSAIVALGIAAALALSPRISAAQFTPDWPNGGDRARPSGDDVVITTPAPSFSIEAARFVQRFRVRLVAAWTARAWAVETRPAKAVLHRRFVK